MVARNFIGMAILSSLTGSAAFTVQSNNGPQQTTIPRSTKLEMTKKTNDNNDASISRRNLLNSIVPATLASAALMSQPQPSLAKDELFKPNPLLNPVLEKIRILEQAEADNIQYGGELAPGSPKGRETYAKLLLPILMIQRDLVQIDELSHLEDGKGLEEANKLLSKPYFEKIGFKRTFNAFGKKNDVLLSFRRKKLYHHIKYSIRALIWICAHTYYAHHIFQSINQSSADNIYYSDPDRANAYLGGGAVPKNEQSIAYLLRNDVLTNVENLQAEVAYMIKEKKAGNPLETEDLYLYTKACNEGMVKYLELVPPGEMKIAAELLASS